MLEGCLEKMIGTTLIVFSVRNTVVYKEALGRWTSTDLACWSNNLTRKPDVKQDSAGISKEICTLQ